MDYKKVKIDDDEPIVMSVNLKLGSVFMSNNTIIPIVEYINSSGESIIDFDVTDDINELFSIVAGPTTTNKWWVIKVSDYPEPTIH